MNIGASSGQSQRLTTLVHARSRPPFSTGWSASAYCRSSYGPAIAALPSSDAPLLLPTPNEALGEVGIDPPVSCLVRVGDRRAYVIEFGCTARRHASISRKFSRYVHCEGQTEKLIRTGEARRLVVTSARRILGRSTAPRAPSAGQRSCGRVASRVLAPPAAGAPVPGKHHLGRDIVTASNPP
jgi:hypothetical protein